MRKSRSFLMAREYWKSTAVNSNMSFSRMAFWNEVVRIWILWLIEGEGHLVAVTEFGEVGGLSLLLRATSRLWMWLVGVMQIRAKRVNGVHS